MAAADAVMAAFQQALRIANKEDKDVYITVEALGRQRSEPLVLISVEVRKNGGDVITCGRWGDEF